MQPISAFQKLFKNLINSNGWTVLYFAKCVDNKQEVLEYHLYDHLLFFDFFFFQMKSGTTRVRFVKQSFANIAGLLDADG